MTAETPLRSQVHPQPAERRMHHPEAMTAGAERGLSRDRVRRALPIASAIRSSSDALRSTAGTRGERDLIVVWEHAVLSDLESRPRQFRPDTRKMGPRTEVGGLAGAQRPGGDASSDFVAAASATESSVDRLSTNVIQVASAPTVSSALWIARPCRRRSSRSSVAALLSAVDGRRRQAPNSTSSHARLRVRVLIPSGDVARSDTSET